MAKRLTNDQKEKIIDSFKKGESIDELSKLYKCTKPTIIRNLKKNFGDKKYKELISKNKPINKSSTFNNKDDGRKKNPVMQKINPIFAIFPNFNENASNIFIHFNYLSLRFLQDSNLRPTA